MVSMFAHSIDYELVGKTALVHCRVLKWFVSDSLPLKYITKLVETQNIKNALSVACI